MNNETQSKMNNETQSNLLKAHLQHNGTWIVPGQYAKGDLIFGQYQIIKCIEGRLYTTYITQDNVQNHFYCIKELKKNALTPDDTAQHNHNTWLQLGYHPNIAYHYFSEKMNDIDYLFIEYIEGGNLTQWIEKKRFNNLGHALEIAIQCCHGIQWAHSQSVIHGDIRPEKILINRYGQVKLTDFGLALKRQSLFASESIDDTEQDAVNLAYIPPEQWASVDDSATPSDGLRPKVNADVYSFGICLWQFFCGELPYQVENAHAFSTYELQQPVHPRDLRSDLPDSLCQILQAIINWDPGKRLTDIATVLERLNETYVEQYHCPADSYQCIHNADSAIAELNNKGCLYYKQGDFTAAKATFQQALPLMDDNLQIIYNLGIVQWRHGEINATELLQKINNKSSKNDEMNLQIKTCQALIHHDSFIPPPVDGANSAPANSGYGAFSSNEKSQQPILLSTLDGHSDTILAMAENKTKSCFLSSSKDASLKRWDLKTKQCVWEINALDHFINAIAIEKSGQHFITANRSHAIQLWDLEKATCIQTSQAYTHYISSLVLPDNQGQSIHTAVSASIDGTIQIWDFAAGGVIKNRLIGHQGAIYALALMNEAHCVISAGEDKSIKVWNLDTGHCIHTLQGHQSVIYALALCDNGRFVVSASEDKTIGLWDIKSGKLIRFMTGHEAAVVSLTVDKASRFIMSGGYDQTIRVWSVETGQCISTTQLDEAYIRPICLLANDQMMISSGSDHSLKLWSTRGLTSSATPVLLLPPDVMSKKALKPLNLFHQSISEIYDWLQKNEYHKAWSLLYTLWQQHDFFAEPVIVNLYQMLLAYAIKSDSQLYYKIKLQEQQTQSAIPVNLGEGRYALSGSSDDTLQLWDTSTGESIATLKGHRFSVSEVAVSQDSKYALSSSFDQTLRLWDMATKKTIHTLEGHNKSILCAAISKHGKFGLSGGKDKVIYYWDLVNGEPLQTLKAILGNVNSVVFCPDEQHAVSAHGDKAIILWDLKTAKIVNRMEGHQDIINCVVVNDNATMIASAAADNTIMLWELKTGQYIRSLEGHTSSVNDLCFSANGKKLLSGSSDKTMKLWDVITGNCVRTYQGHKDSILCVALSQNGLIALSGSWDKTIRYWKTNSSECVKVMEGHSGFIRSVKFLDNGQGIFLNYGDKKLNSGTLQAYNYFTKKQYQASWEILKKTWEKIDFSKDKTIQSIYSNLRKKNTPNGVIKIQPNNEIFEHKGIVDSVALSVDGQIWATASGDKTLKLWDWHSQKCIATLEGHTDWISSVAITTDGRYLISAGFDKTIKIWDTHNHQCMVTLTAHLASIIVATVTIDGKYIVSGGADRTLKIWDLLTHQCVRTLKTSNNDVLTIALSVDAHTIYSGGCDSAITQWDFSTGHITQQFRGHSDWVSCLALSIDGKQLLSGSFDETIKLWDITTGICQFTLAGHTGAVTAVALHTEGRFALSASEDQTIRVWDLDNQQSIYSINVNKQIKSIALSLDNHFLITGNHDNSISIWNIIWDLSFTE